MRASPSTAPHTFRASARFDILSQVGQGGMGFVYAALDRELNTRIALKTLRTPDAQAILLLKKEFRAIQDLSHPNLVTPKELFEQDGRWFFTMDLVEGTDFLSHTRPLGANPGPADEARLRGALVQLAIGLCALHANHKVHRDIKPANVLVTPDGRVRILDFGIVSDLTEASHGDEAGALVGTLHYMAPEQAGGEGPVTPAADWYAVGVMLYQALTGRLPFIGDMTEIVEAKLVGDVIPPIDVEPSVPADLNALCMALLTSEPAERPEGFQILRRTGVAPSPESVSLKRASTFVGRARELGAMDDALAFASAGNAVTMLVEGESGVGKSLLVREFTSRVTGALVFRGRCYERESLPYKAVDSLIDDLARYLASLSNEKAAALLPEGAAALRTVFPVLDTIHVLEKEEVTHFDALSPHEARVQMFACVRALFANIARHRQIVLVIDDLQWADIDSLALLTEMLRPPDAPSLLLLASIRTATERAKRGESVHERLAQLPGEVRWLHLEPLPEADARTLIRHLLENAPREAEGALDVDAICAEAKGHPLFIDELVRHRLAHSDGEHARLDDALWDRASRLPPTARKLLEVVAVAGVPMQQQVVAKAAALDLGQLFDAVGSLRAAHFVRTSGVYRHDTLEAYHDRVRESVLNRLDGQAKKDWHGRLALALESTGEGDPEKLIPHWVGAGEAARGAEYAIRAADASAAALAFDHAASLYRLALDLAPPAGDAAIALKVKLAQALTNAGRGADAAAAYLDAAGKEISNRAIDLRRLAGEQLVGSGRVDEGAETLIAVLHELGIYAPEKKGISLLLILFWSLWLAIRGFKFKSRREEDVDARTLLRIDAFGSAGPGLGMSDHVRGRDYQTRYLALALKVGEPKRVGRALAYYAFAVSSGGHRYFKSTMAIGDVVGAMAKELGSAYLDALDAGVRAFGYYLSAHFAQSIPHFIHAEEVLRTKCLGVAHELGSSRMLLYRAHLYLGDFAEVAPQVETALNDCEQRGDNYMIVSLRAICTYFLALVRDDVEAAEAEIARAERHLPKHGFHVQHAHFWIGRGQMRLYQGAAARLHDELGQLWPTVRKSHLLRIQTIRIAYFDLRARTCITLLANGGSQALRTEANSLLRDLAREPVAWAAALAEVVRAGFAELDGKRDRAIAHLTEAQRVFDAEGIRVSREAVRWQRGQLLGGDAGHALIAEAEAWMQSQGVRNVARLVALYVPGFSERASSS